MGRRRERAGGEWEEERVRVRAKGGDGERKEMEPHNRMQGKRRERKGTEGNGTEGKGITVRVLRLFCVPFGAGGMFFRGKILALQQSWTVLEIWNGLGLTQGGLL